jgi:hypothetical protein
MLKDSDLGNINPEITFFNGGGQKVYAKSAK